MVKVKTSLSKLLGKDFIEAVIAGAEILHGMDRKKALELADEEIEFMPQSFVDNINNLLDRVGTKIIPEIKDSITGAPTDSYRKASNLNASPVGGVGFLRLGEDGRLYLAAKSEHYHIPLGHNFPGYKLLDNAKALGISNATHNNTRGYITRLLERELIRTVNSIEKEDEESLEKVLNSREPHVLNRVINLETGSLACEAGVKMMLSRFYKIDGSGAEPKYADRIPVFFVVGDKEGGRKANYHGTTVITQTMRDLWPDYYNKIEEAEIYKVCPVAINDIDDFKAKFKKYNNPPYKVAGFLHEIILMNYAGIKLSEEYLQEVYRICHENDTPVMCDEIQSCMFVPGMYLFKQYNLKPDFLIVGKGFPGGIYAASRIFTTYEMDSLNQFGALVTNGQEELASLSYLVTMYYANEIEDYVKEISTYYESNINKLAENYPTLIKHVEGMGLLKSICFHEAEKAYEFVSVLNDECIDISCQTYKEKFPPAALTKPPIISTRKMVDFLIEKMDNTLKVIKEVSV